MENSFFGAIWMFSRKNFHEILAERKSFISNKLQHFFLSRLKEPPEEDIRFLFLVFTQLNVRQNPTVRKFSLTSRVDKHEVVVITYWRQKYSTGDITLVKVFTGTIYCTLQYHVFPINSPQLMWEVLQCLIILCHCQPFLFCFGIWKDKIQLNEINPEHSLLTNSNCCTKHFLLFQNVNIFVDYFIFFKLQNESETPEGAHTDLPEAQVGNSSGKGKKKWVTGTAGKQERKISVSEKRLNC